MSLRAPHSPGRFLLVALAVALALAGVERVGDRLTKAALPTGEATWIWAADAARRSEPVAFYLLRDFDLPRAFVPGTPTELLLTVDEEYRLWVNGFAVADGFYRLGAPLDEIDVGGVLQPGRNRILLEAHSRSGAGGVLALLRSGAGPSDAERVLLVSDSSWSVVRRHEPGLIEGLTLPSEPEPPLVWRRPSIGRWGRPWREAGAEPSNAALAVAQGRLGGRRAEAIESTFVQLRRGGPRGEDLEIPAVLIDFGAPVRGELELWLQADPARVYPFEVALEAPPREPIDPGRLEGGIPSPEQPVVMLVPGRSWWRDTAIREMRWVRVIGVTDVAAARIQPVEGEAADPGDRAPWLLGIEPRPEAEGGPLAEDTGPRSSGSRGSQSLKPETGSNSTTSVMAPSVNR